MYDVLHVVCDEFANEYIYSLCIRGVDGSLEDRLYFEPTHCSDKYILDLDSCSEEFIWY